MKVKLKWTVIFKFILGPVAPETCTIYIYTPSRATQSCSSSMKKSKSRIVCANYQTQALEAAYQSETCYLCRESVAQFELSWN